ncbi:MAG: hypothetical protein ABII01_07115 [Candidatus Woesearchaeota archaeon]
MKGYDMTRRGFLAAAATALAGCATTYDQSQLSGRHPVPGQREPTPIGDQALSLEAKIPEGDVAVLYDYVKDHLPGGDRYFVPFIEQGIAQAFAGYVPAPAKAGVRNINFGDNERTGFLSKPESAALYTYLFERFMEDVQQVAHLSINPERTNGVTDVFVYHNGPRMPSINYTSREVKGWNKKTTEKDTVYNSIDLCFTNAVEVRHKVRNYRGPVEFFINAALQGYNTTASLGEPIIGVAGYTAGAATRGALTWLFHKKDEQDAFYDANVDLGWGSQNLGPAQKMWETLSNHNMESPVVYLAPIESKPGSVDTMLMVLANNPNFAVQPFPTPNYDPETGRVMGMNIVSPPQYGDNFAKNLVISMLGEMADAYVRGLLIEDLILDKLEDDKQLLPFGVPIPITRILPLIMPLPIPFCPRPSPMIGGGWFGGGAFGGAGLGGAGLLGGGFTGGGALIPGPL